MTWEDIIIKIRKQPEFSDLVEKAYFDEDLVLNVERFSGSVEFAETKKIILSHFNKTSGLKILDVGSGNGISAVSFSLDGNAVSCVEPDKSNTVGSGAIRKLADHFKLKDFRVFDSFGENLPFDSYAFDLVYIRQAMHHAHDLRMFVKETARVLKKGGLLLTVRDHVVFNDKDKQWFLESHPLHKFYGGENAFTFNEYASAIKGGGLKIKKVLRYFDSVINYFPMEESDIAALQTNRNILIVNSLKRKIPLFLANNILLNKIYAKYIELRLGPVLNEKQIPGRMYTFISAKPL